MSTDVAVLRVLLILVYVGTIAYFGLRRRKGFASWHMFAGVGNCTFNLKHGARKKSLNPWDFLPHTHLSMTKDEAELFLLFLEKLHDIEDLNGQVEIRSNYLFEVAEVRDSKFF